jgi:hypothetical protein
MTVMGSGATSCAPSIGTRVSESAIHPAFLVVAK